MQMFGGAALEMKNDPTAMKANVVDPRGYHSASEQHSCWHLSGIRNQRWAIAVWRTEEEASLQ